MAARTPRRLTALLGAALAVGVAAGLPGVGAAAPAPDEGQGTVDRQGRSMAWRLSYRLPAPVVPPTSTGTTPVVTTPAAAPPTAIPMQWVAYGGSRTTTRLRRLAGGQVTLTPVGGVVTFSRRVQVPTAGPMSGGFCAEFDLTALGIAEPARSCPTGPTASRSDLPGTGSRSTLSGGISTPSGAQKCEIDSASV